MHDSSIEDLLRRTLRDEAETLSLTVSVGRLERLLTERRRQTRTNRSWLAAAAIAAVALTGGIAAVTQLRGEVPPTGATPRPSASPSPLPEATTLLAGYPDATLRLERSVGPATGPANLGASSGPGASPTPIEVGQVKFTGPFIIAVACIGQGELVAEVRTPSFDIPYTQAVAPCDGRPVFSEYLSAPIDPSSSGDTINVIVSEGASWRLAVGEYPASLMTPPEFGPVALTEGWNVVSNGGPTLVSTTTGAHVTVPDDATRVGVFVQCQGAGTASIAVTGSPTTDVACDTADTRRVEFSAVGGEPLELTATVRGERLWIRLIVEADGDIASTYAPAPAMPAAVAAAPYAAPDPNVVAFGTIGSSHQTVMPMSNARPGLPGGDLLPVARFDEVDGARLELVSISRGAVLRTLASAPAPALIFDSWADGTHEQVYYAMAVETAIEFHRVTAAGTDDTLLATAPRDPTAVKAHLAVDDSVFVVEVCVGGSGCTRTIVDGATAAVRQIDGPAGPVCRILGVVAGTIIEAGRPVCSEDAPTDVVAVPLEGGASTVLIDDADASVGDSFIVPTSEGPKLVLLGPVGPDAIPWDVLDVTTGDTTLLPPGAVGTTPLVTAEIRLPDGWVLLMGGGLGDFPWQRAFDRPVPVLVNLVTEERIELVNLPNWKGNY
jgi:hypothetical protein